MNFFIYLPLKSMKKFLIIVALVTFLSTSFIVSKGFSYHIGTCNRACLKTRHTTNRIFSLRRQNLKENCCGRCNLNYKRISFRDNYNKQIQNEYNHEKYSIYRASHSSLFPRNNNLLSNSQKRSIRETAYHQNFKWTNGYKFDYKKYENKFFKEKTGNIHFDIPISFIKIGTTKYYDARRDLTVNLSEGNTYYCGDLGFNLCLAKGSKQLRKKRGYSNIRNLSQKFELRKMINGNKYVSVPVYKESFVNNGQIHYFYTIMNPYNRNLVGLEGVAPVENEYASSNLVNAIFNSIEL